MKREGSDRCTGKKQIMWRSFTLQNGLIFRTQQVKAEGFLFQVNSVRKTWVTLLSGTALFVCVACSGSGAAANGAANNGKCVPEIAGLEPSVTDELFNAMFAKNSPVFEPMIRRSASDSASKQRPSFSYTPKNRGWAPVVGLLDVVVRAYPKGRSGGMPYSDRSPFFSSSRHEDFIDVVSEIDPLTESVPEGLTGIMFRLSVKDDQGFDDIFRQYQVRNKWLSTSNMEVDRLGRVCAVALFREGDRIQHVAMIANDASSSTELLQEKVYLPSICSRRMNAVLAGFQGISAGRLLELNQGVLVNGTRNERIYGMPESWVSVVKKLSEASRSSSKNRTDLCQSLSSK